MASATRLPEQPSTGESNSGHETEPLLGRREEAVLSERATLVTGLFVKTGILAEMGVLTLCCYIWAHVAAAPTSLFSGHPIAMSTALFILTQSVLFQQPIDPGNPERKRRGQYIHAALSLAALMALVTGFTIIEVYKARMSGSNPLSAHAFCGLSTLLLLMVQYVVGFTMWMTPWLYGGEARAKSLYKYHRYGGYLMLLMILATAVTATLTGYNKGVLGVEPWVASLGTLLIAIGVFPRIQKQKLGFGVSQQPVDGL